MSVLFSCFWGRVCTNEYVIVLQSRRVKEENPEVSGGYLFSSLPRLPPQPPPTSISLISLGKNLQNFVLVV